MLATCICLNGSLLDQLSCTIVYFHNLFTCTFGRINMSVCLSVWSLRLNVYCTTGMPVIESIIFCPISFARHKSTSPVAFDSRQDVPQRCALSKRIYFRHCGKKGVSVFHATPLPRCTCLYVLFIGAVFGSTQLLHCSIYLSAGRHSK